MSKPGYGFKRVRELIGGGRPLHFRLLSDRILGYAWPKWYKGGDRVEFRMHSVEIYALGLWRYELHKKFVFNKSEKHVRRLAGRSLGKNQHDEHS